MGAGGSRESAGRPRPRRERPGRLGASRSLTPPMCASPPTVHAHSLVAAPSVTLKALDAVPPQKFVLSLPPVPSCYAHWPLRAPCMGTQLLGTPGVPSPAVETPDVETQVCRPQMDPEPPPPAAPTLFSAPSTLSLCICWECGAGLTKSQNAHQSSPWGR